MRMRASVDFFEALNGEMGVYLCAGEAGVTEKFLHRAEVRSTIEHMCRKAMSQRVGAHLCTCGQHRCRVLMNDTLHAPARERPTPMVDEDMRDMTVFRKFRPDGEIRAQRPYRRRTQQR